MRKNAEIRGCEKAQQVIDSAVQGWRGSELAKGNTREWRHFESVLGIFAASRGFYLVRVGEGSGEEVLHGTFSRPNRPLHPEISFEPIVGFEWRGVDCRYIPATSEQFLRVEVSGEISGPTERSVDSLAWQKAVFVKSWFAAWNPAMFDLAGITL